MHETEDEVLATLFVHAQPSGNAVPVVLLEFFPQEVLGLPTAEAGAVFRKWLASRGWLPAHGFFDDTGEWFSGTTLALRLDRHRNVTIEDHEQTIYSGSVKAPKFWVSLARKYGDIPVLAGSGVGSRGRVTNEFLRDAAGRGLLMIAAAAATLPSE